MNKTNRAYLNAYTQLNPEQKRAVNHIDGPVMVVAGPGSGKTQLLATRVGRILEQADLAPENILCLTFSDAAAKTMQQRLSDLIGPAAYSVTVSTYHSFGSEIIRLNAEYYNLGPDPRPADDLLLDQTLRSVINDLEYANPLKQNVFIKDIKALISGYKRSLISPSQLIDICQNNLSFIKQASVMVNDIIDQPRISKRQIVKFTELLKSTATIPSTKVYGAVELKQLWLEELGAAVETASLSQTTSQLSKWKTRWLEKDETNNFRVKGLRQTARQIALAEIYEAYLTKLNELNLYDYDDMILLAIEGLIANPDLRYTLQERYLYVQLDEFQDTNEAQLNLVEQLLNNPVNEKRPNVLAVGDDDQAIYAFQGAHYSHIKRFIDTYNDVKLINLKTNYRSTPGIIELAAGIRSQISDSLDLTDKRQVSANPNAAETVSRIELPLDSESLAWSAEYIHKLIEKGTPANEIAVLAPKHKHLSALIPYLHAKNIAVSYDQQSNVIEDELIAQLIDMARLATVLKDNPALANSLWPKVLSFRFWQLPAELIWQLSWDAYDNRADWLTWLNNNPKLKPIACFFIQLNLISEYSSFELMLNYLIGSLPLELNQPQLKEYKSPFYDYYFKDLTEQSLTIDANEWRTLGHLSILRARVRASSEEGLNLTQFVEFIDSYKAAEIKILDSRPFQESSDSINLMTAFNAKGQQFNTVVLIDLVDQVWGVSARNQSSRIGLPYNLAQVRHDNNSDDEKLRLLFVAISRTKRNLVLISYQSELSGKQPMPLKYLAEHHVDGDLISPYLPDSSAKVITPKIKFEDLSSIKPAWFENHLDRFKPNRRSLLSGRLSTFKLSATKLNNYGDVSRGGPRQFYLESILMFPSAPSLTAQFGSVMHATLDWQFKRSLELKKSPTLKLVLAEFERLLKQKRLPTRDYKQLVKRAEVSLTAYFNQTNIINGENDLSEEKFELRLNDALLSGEVDRLIIDRKNKTIEIIDFKTGSCYERFGADIKSFHHARQLYFYKLLVEGSAKFKGYQVNRARIQFVEPDLDSGKITSLSLEFNEKDEKLLIDLIAAVWRQIMQLSFPNTDQYPLSLPGIKQFETSLINDEPGGDAAV